MTSQSSVVVTLLDDPSTFAGGDLHLFGAAIPLELGDSIRFPAFALHHVSALEAGRRRVLVHSLLGPAF
jgi:predicted 2-oxoglutarate/Fe(II)-dependent dioxygenase YbiX